MEDIPQKQISGAEVLRVFDKTSGSNYRYQISVQKAHLMPDRIVNSINKNCSELDEEQKQNLIAFCEKWGGRMPIHIYRMLGNGRSKAEKDFAIKFIEEYEKIYKEILEEDKASGDDVVDLQESHFYRILGGENVDSGMFWTFAPYIFKNLSGQNINSQDRIRKILNWGLVMATPIGILNEESKQVHLKGFEKVWDDLGGNLYYLSIDPNDTTHKFTDQEAQKLVKGGVFDEK